MELAFPYIYYYNKEKGGIIVRILICDDELRYADAIRASITRWQKKNCEALLQLDVFLSSEDLLDSLHGKIFYDLAFLDIQFPSELNGLQTAQMLRKGNAQMVIVFVSNYDEYAIDGYRVNALRYLSKPISDAQIFECVDIAWKQWQLSAESHIIVESRQQVIKLSCRTIKYIETQGHYLLLYTTETSSEPISIRKKLSEFVSELPTEMFVQCHRGYAVNLIYVKRISRIEITLLDGGILPLSMRYRDSVLTCFRQFFQGEL